MRYLCALLPFLLLCHLISFENILNLYLSLQLCQQWQWLWRKCVILCNTSSSQPKQPSDRKIISKTLCCQSIVVNPRISFKMSRLGGGQHITCCRGYDSYKRQSVITLQSVITSSTIPRRPILWHYSPRVKDLSPDWNHPQDSGFLAACSWGR